MTNTMRSSLTLVLSVNSNQNAKFMVTNTDHAGTFTIKIGHPSEYNFFLWEWLSSTLQKPSNCNTNT